MILEVRSKLSTFGGFGEPTEVTCGGNALKFYASVRLNIKRIGLVKKGEEVSSNFENLGMPGINLLVSKGVPWRL
ncbi:hypothetical protein RIF29_09007 [Crotalaria pallida]|uniref:RecA family profile 2 domain-containing protein n=1 Tax=Crotalaria pallida TaxID=3830 RepID=A0AAN9FZ63_CROPI